MCQSCPSAGGTLWTPAMFPCLLRQGNKAGLFMITLRPDNRKSHTLTSLQVMLKPNSTTGVKQEPGSIHAALSCTTYYLCHFSCSQPSRAAKSTSRRDSRPTFVLFLNIFASPELSCSPMQISPLQSCFYSRLPDVLSQNCARHISKSFSSVCPSPRAVRVR